MKRSHVEMNPAATPHMPATAAAATTAVGTASTSTLPPQLQSKRPRAGRRDAFPLGDLPEDVLTQIMRTLCHLRGDAPLRCRGLRAAGDAFALATCNHRMLRLFRTTCLSRLDGSHSPDDEAELLAGGVFVRSSVQHPRHLHSVAWLAGSHLRELRLPPYGRILFSARHVLSAVADFCPNVELLTFPDSVDTPPELMSALFESLGTKLKTLSIAGPELTTLEALLRAEKCRPEHLELTGCLSKCAGLILDYMRWNGFGLRSAKVGFKSAHVFHDISFDTEFNSSVPQFLGFLTNELLTVCPHLDSIDIGLSSPTEFVHDSEHAENVSFPHIVMDDVSAFLARNDENLSGKQSTLKRIRVGARGEFVLEHVKRLASLISPKTTLEVDFPGAGIVFPPSDGSSRKPFFRALQLGRFALAARLLVMDSSPYRNLELVDIGTTSAVGNYQGTASPSYPALQALCSAAGDSLRVVRVSISLDYLKGVVLNFLTDLLELCPNVHCLEISRELVSVAARDPPMGQRIAKMLAQVKSLRLSISEMYSSNRYWSANSSIWSRYLAGSHSLLQCVPEFVKILEKSCPKLRNIYIDKVRDIFHTGQTLFSPATKKEMRHALWSISNYEEAWPNADFGTLKSQIVAWMSQCH